MFLPELWEPVVDQFANFAIGQHEDAHEFLHFVLEKAHEELEAIAKHYSHPHPQHDAEAESLDGWHEVSAKNRAKEVTNEVRFTPSLVSSVFGGSLKIELCKKGMVIMVKLGFHVHSFGFRVQSFGLGL